MTSLVTIGLYDNRSEALVAKSFLEAYGIYAILPDLLTASNAWHYTTALQGIRLCILDADAERANALLSDVKETPITQGKLRKSDLVIAGLAYLVAGIPHPVRRHESPD